MGIALELVPRILRFAFLHSVIVLTLLDRIARYVCTYNPCVQRQQIKIKTAKKRERRGEGWLLLEENQSSSLRNRLSSEGDREYNKQRSLRGRRQSRRRAQHPHSCNPLRNRCTDLPFRKYILSKGDGFAEKAAAKERHLNSYVL